jgi:hypothetical protein
LVLPVVLLALPLLLLGVFGVGTEGAAEGLLSDMPLLAELLAEEPV